jgi:hypothetical protein
MAQYTPPVDLSRRQSERPPGVGPSALALLALLIGTLLQHLPAPGAGPDAAPTFELLRIGLYFGVGVPSIWQLWRGRRWARLLVLLWSAASVAGALAFLSEHNLDPAALMGRPLSFFQAVLAAVLLYWLNTPKVRAWYRKSSAGAGELIAERLQGRLCTGVEFHADAGLWRLHFEHEAELILRCPWRIVLDDNLAFAAAHAEDASDRTQAPRSSDPPAAEQQPPETVPAPGHSPQEARRLLENLRVRAVRVAPHSSDLFLSFEMGIEVQTWTAPASRAASTIPSKPAAGAAPRHLWEYSDPGFTLVANQTGAKLAIVQTEPER